MLTNKDEEIAGWNAKAQEVVRHYGTYNGQSTGNTAGLPRDYGDLTLPSGGADIEHAEKPPAVTPPAGHDDHRTAGDRATQPEPAASRAVGAAVPDRAARAGAPASPAGGVVPDGSANPG